MFENFKSMLIIPSFVSELTKLSVVFAPTNLRHIDVSYNNLDQLPEWLSCCHELRSLFASHNNLTSLPDHLFCNEMPYLQTLQLAYNKLHGLPNLPRRLPLGELFLQNNSLSILPENFFRALHNIRVLNLSNNRLCELPVPEENCPLEKLYLTANCLTDKTMNRIGAYLLKLRVFHGAYNCFTSLPEDCSNCWPDIEEIVLSGNKILRLPDAINSQQHLTVLRVHSNLLQNCPPLCNLTSLRALDLAHNQLDRIDLRSIVPPNLKFLDLSCNLNLHVDSQQFHCYKQQRPMSLVDVSGKNRTSLPLIPSPFCENDGNDTCWTVGFSETAGCKQRLYISQVRLPAFCNTEALFGMFDGESNNTMPVTVDKVVPRILLEERTVKETANEYMKYTMLSSHRELKDKSQKSGMSAIIIHILKQRLSTSDYTFCGGTRRYVLRASSVGEVRAVIGRSTGPFKVLSTSPKKQIKTSPRCQLIVPDPDVSEIFLDEQDEFMIVANKNLWDVMSFDAAVAEVRSQSNVILAAKRLQDLAQAYGAEDNLSVIVVRFNIVKSDVDQLMRELRQTIRKNKYQSGGSTTTNTTICQAGCCCETNSCVHCLEKTHQMTPNDDRSSPSGQSDQACSDCNSSAKLFIHHLGSSKQNDMNRSSKSYDISEQKISPERRSYRGVAKAVRAKREEDRSREETDSALSEEQFKCWEYMLEQNTQLLFDKELNTISKGMRRHAPFPLSKAQTALSRSSPHLADTNPLPAVPLLSRQFGSTRSFNPLPARPSRFTPDRRQLIGGPHAAYFGSLQRLMPYNLEYDFAVMQERGLADSMELDRMNQYWGVTTTEL